MHLHERGKNTAISKTRNRIQLCKSIPASTTMNRQMLITRSTPIMACPHIFQCPQASEMSFGPNHEDLRHQLPVDSSQIFLFHVTSWHLTDNDLFIPWPEGRIWFSGLCDPVELPYSERFTWNIYLKKLNVTWYQRSTHHYEIMEILHSCSTLLRVSESMLSSSLSFSFCSGLWRLRGMLLSSHSCLNNVIK